MMRLPKIHGLIRRRLLVNFRADADVVQRCLPRSLRPKCHAGQAIVGVCLIRLEEIRPVGVPRVFGLSSENAAHRVAVTWRDDDGTDREGVFIPRRDTSSVLNRIVGGRLFPGEHNPASFAVTDDGHTVSLDMHSSDGCVAVTVRGKAGDALPNSSCFSSVADASRFFEGGSLGYSVTRDPTRLDGLCLHTPGWHVEPFTVDTVESSWCADPDLFPPGIVEFDHALIMRNIEHEWRDAPQMIVPIA